MTPDPILAGNSESPPRSTCGRDAGPRCRPERDQRLAELIDELSEQLRPAHRPTSKRVARRHGDLAAELRSLWGAMLVADCVAQEPKRRAAVGPGDEPTTAHSGAHSALPARRPVDASGRVRRTKDARLAITNCSTSWGRAGWASSIARGKSASTGSWR